MPSMGGIKGALDETDVGGVEDDPLKTWWGVRENTDILLRIRR
jgi:hypothetical protein